uniref:Uncharacterized protein n=1 Tax=Parascaris equorum TaxID=6256 RepID=A0A914S7P1_PAREQ
MNFKGNSSVFVTNRRPRQVYSNKTALQLKRILKE